MAVLHGTTFASAQQKDAEVLEANAAQTLLLLTDHLKNINEPTTLRYSFERKSDKAGDSFKDIVDVKITKVYGDGAKDISFDFFTGQRRRPYADVSKFRTNALVMVSMTRDVWQMARAIGAGAQQANYFSKRINVAFREKPKVEEVTIDTGQGPLKATKLTVTPFVGDYNIAKFKKFENKIYEFYFSDDIPGQFYMTRTLVPSGEADKSSGPRVEEITRFQEQLPAK